jgi:hypothetical protein
VSTVEGDKVESRYLIQETLQFIVYPEPVTDRILPNTGFVTGQTKVILHGHDYDLSLGGIYCRFGETSDKIVPA